MQEFFSNILQIIRSLHISPKNIVEMVILAYLLYHILVWIKSTRTWFIFKGVVVLLVFIILANLFKLNVITFLAKESLNVILTALLVIFAPELRAVLEQLGQSNRLLKLLNGSRSKAEGQYNAEVTQELVKAAFAMARTRTGALIVIERELQLEEYIRTGISVDALVSSALLINIFEKNTPLHDGAVVLRGNRVAAATCYLPLSNNPEINKAYGTRHRAAIGASENSDSVVLVVSEETGDVSLAKGGELLHGLTPEELTRELSLLETEQETGKTALGKTFGRNKPKKNKTEKEEKP